NEDQVVEEYKVGEAVQVNVLPERVEENMVEDESISKEYVILIIEDNDELRTFIRESLEKRYHILESDNGLSGWEMAKEQIPDVIISDVTMPGMDGLELCSKL